MAWEEARKKKRRREMPPTVGVDPAGLYLNRSAMDVVGRDKRAIRLFHDADVTPQQLGLWFFKKKHDTDKPERSYSVVHYPNGTARVSCASWIRDRGLLKIKRRVGKSSFMILLDKDTMTSGEFYRAKLE